MPLEQTAAQLRGIAVRLREFGDRGALTAMRAGIRAEATPLLNRARGRARETLPQSGGLADRVANSRMRVSTLTGLRTAGVRLQTFDLDTRETDSGYVRHPTFGKQPWVQQSVPAAAGWWTDTMRSGGPPVAAAIEAQIRRVAAEIAAL